MIGYTQPGKLIVQNIKMFQQTWTDAQTVLPTTQTPGYNLMLVSASLVRSNKIFAGGGAMTATNIPTYMHICSGNAFSSPPVDSIIVIEDTGPYQTFNNFFNGNRNLMVGFFNDEQSAFADQFFRIIIDNAPIYDNNTANDVYCYLSLSYYLVPTL